LLSPQDHALVQQPRAGWREHERNNVSSRLDRITDWAALAQASRYCAADVARECRVSPRQLERYFQVKHGAAPHQWLRRLRLFLAVERIRHATPLKVVAIELGYKDPAHFNHDFKAYFGISPSCLDPNPSGRASER
jgi:AraC family transcriptional regulator